MEIPASDALDEGLLLFAVGKFQVGREVSGDRKSLLLRAGLLRQKSLPRFIAPNAKWSCVRRLRCSFCAEEAFGHIPPAFGELRRAEGDVHVVGIMEDHVVISVDVAIVRGAAQPTAGSGSAQRMVLENPVADVNHMDVLLDNDVAGENAIVDPVAKAFLHW